MRPRATAACAALLAAALLLGPAGPAAAAGDAAAREAIAARLASAIQEGYATGDAERIVALYDADAAVRTRVYGEITVQRLRELLAADLKACAKVKAEAKVSGVAVTGAEATAEVRVTVRAERDGKPISREDVNYYRLRDEGGVWKIVLQSYRPDFSMATGPAHGGGVPSGHAPDPGAPKRMGCPDPQAHPQPQEPPAAPAAPAGPL